MIELNIQIKLIVFSFIFGFIFSHVLELFNRFVFKYNNILKFILSFILIAFCTFVYFVGIDKIGYAIFHIYSILSITAGFIFYDILIKNIFK